MASVEVAEAHAVEHDEHLVERAATHTDIRLCAVGAACTHVNTRQIL